MSSDIPRAPDAPDDAADLSDATTDNGADRSTAPTVHRAPDADPPIAPDGPYDVADRSTAPIVHRAPDADPPIAPDPADAAADVSGVADRPAASIAPDAPRVADVPIAPDAPDPASVPIALDTTGTVDTADPVDGAGAPIAAEVESRRLHPLTLLFSTAEVAQQLIFPALVSGFSGGDGNAGRIFLIIVLVLAVPGAGVAAARYLRFRYALAGDELVIRSGVFSRTHRVIPLARVQNVDVKQSIFQRLLHVAELRVETAGAGSDAEAALSVLGAAEAQALRGELLARRRAARAGTAAPVADGAPETAGDAVPAPAGRLLKKLSFRDVLLAGATANEAGVIAAMVLGSMQLLDDVGLPYLERLGDASDWLVRAAGAGAGVVLLVGGLLVLLLVLGWVFSLAGAVVRYHGFTLVRADGELRKHYGLLTLHEASVPLERVQAIRVEEPVLRRALGLVSLKIETAGAAPGQGGNRAGGAEAFVPLARRGEVAELVRGIFDDFEMDADAPLRQVHPRARRRAARRWMIRIFLPAALLAAAEVAMADAHLSLLLLLPVLPLPWLLARREYAIRGYAVADGYVVARAGVLGRVTWIVPEHKLQTLHLRQSPFQRRHGLASIVVDTAAGGRQAAIADLGADQARELLDVLASGIRESARLRRRRRPLTAPSTVAIDAGEAGDPQRVPSEPLASPA